MEILEKKALWLMLIFTVISCSKDETFNNCNQGSDEINILEKGNTTKGFFSNECELYSSQEEAFFVIQNPSQLAETIDCDGNLPEIDFEKYTLLFGQKELNWCCATALKQEVTKDCEKKEYTYFVQLNNPEEKYHALSTFYHWVVIPKVPSEYQVKLQLDLN